MMQKSEKGMELSRVDPEVADKAYESLLKKAVDAGAVVDGVIKCPTLYKTMSIIGLEDMWDRRHKTFKKVSEILTNVAEGYLAIEASTIGKYLKGEDLVVGALGSA